MNLCRSCLQWLMLVALLVAKLESVEINGRYSDHEFDDHIDFKHPDTGEVLQLKSRGKFKSVIDLNRVRGLKRITCVLNKLHFAFEDSDAAKSWTSGDVIMGNENWECQLGLSHAPEKGIFRKISAVKILNNRRVDVITTEANFLDLFEHADIFYHHSPAKNKPAANVTKEHVRKRRQSLVDQFKSWVAEKTDWAKEKILSSIFPINWEGGEGIVRGVNYDPNTGNAAGKFGVDMTKTKDIGLNARDNTWFQHEKNVETDTTKIHSEGSITSRLECVACYLSFSAAVTFELKIGRDSNNRISFQKYLLQFDAEAKINYDVKFTVAGEYSINLEKRLWKSGSPVSFNIPIAKQFGVSLKVELGAELWLHAAFEANAQVSVTTGFDSMAKFTITNQKIGSNEATTDITRVIKPFNKHSPRVDFSAEATGSLSVFPLIEISAGIAFGLDEKIFEISLTAPVAIGVKPELVLMFEMQAAMGSALVGSFDISLGTEMTYEIRPVRFNIHVVGKRWDWDVLKIPKKGEISLMNKPLSLVSEDKLTCPVVGAKPCDKTTTPVTSRTSSRLKKLTTSNIVFKSENAHYMAPNMAAKLLSFASLIQKHDGWSDRKLVVIQAWRSKRTTGDLAAEGREVRVGVTRKRSASLDTDMSAIEPLKKIAKCAKFCNVHTSGSQVVVGVPQNTGSGSSTGYLTSMKKAKSGQLRVYELPVGQGDATVIQCPNNEGVSFVDIGSRSSISRGYWGSNHITSFLSRRNIAKIKHIFTTHSDADHHNLVADVLRSHPNRASVTMYSSSTLVGGMRNRYPFFNHIGIPPCTTNCPAPVQICTGVNMEIVASQLGTANNEKGIVLRLRYLTHFSMLFVGDVSAPASVTTLLGLPDSRLESDVYKLGHHGSKRSDANEAAFLNKVKPKVVIASGDPWKSYKHPSCISLETAMGISTILKSSNAAARFRAQTDYVCGDDTGRPSKAGSGAAVYTHAPTVNTLNMVAIKYSATTRSMKVVPRQILTDSHATSRRRRSIDGDEEVSESTQAGSDFPLLEWCSADRFKGLSIGQSTGGQSSMDDVCSPIIYPITRDDERFSDLFYYYDDDVEFADTERNDTWCSRPGQACHSCADADEDDDVMDRCAMRMMTFRLAFRLRRLAFLAGQKWTDRFVQVEDAWAEKTSSSRYTWGKYPDGALNYEGRAAKLRLLNAGSGDITQLSMMAQCAGFDYVEVKSSTEIEVCAKPTGGLIGELVSFHKAQLFAVEVPSYLEHEYAYPDALKNETRKAKLLDGVNATQQISDHFSIRDFLSQGKRFFRLDAKLVECLEQIYETFTDFELVKGSVYRPRSINYRDIETRHAEEKYRFQAGQAAELQVKKGTSGTLLELAREVTRACLPVLNFEQLVLGLGAHKRKLYIDMRPQKVGEMLRLKAWDGESSPWFNDLRSFADQVNSGGALIDPVNVARACTVPPLGEEFHFISEQTNDGGSCKDDEPQFCSTTKKYRESLVSDLKKKLKKVIPLSGTAKSAIDACFVTTCGCGIGGSTWAQKVKSCLNFISYYVSKASVAFTDSDKASFFNSANQNSSVHSLACDKGLCVENTQIYSLLKPLLMTTYKPYPGESIEEMVFSSRDNPNPALTLVEQYMAMNVKGEIAVYIEKDLDISVLRKVLKILMVFNEQVTKVVFHVASTASSAKVQENIARKAEFWATGACPKRSRVATTPFEVVDIPKHRHKRSIELSKPRNERMIHMHEWEMRWLTKN